MRGWKIVYASLTVMILYFLIIYGVNGFTEIATRLNIRMSARFSGVLFAFAFMASSLHYFLKKNWTKWLLQNRKYIGVSFALNHLLHLMVLGVLQIFFHPVFEMAKTSSLIGGGMAYLFAVLMLLTSFSTFSRYLSAKQWKLLHLIGGYWIWFIFFKSYWKRVMTETEYLSLTVLLAMVIILRLAKWYKIYFLQKEIN